MWHPHRLWAVSFMECWLLASLLWTLEYLSLRIGEIYRLASSSLLKSLSLNLSSVTSNPWAFVIITLSWSKNPFGSQRKTEPNTRVRGAGKTNADCSSSGVVWVTLEVSGRSVHRGEMKKWVKTWENMWQRVIASRTGQGVTTNLPDTWWRAWADGAFHVPHKGSCPPVMSPAAATVTHKGKILDKGVHAVFKDFLEKDFKCV